MRADWKVAGVAAGLAVLGLVAATVGREARVVPQPSPAASPGTGAGACPSCGRVVSIRVLEVPDEAAAAGSSVDGPVAAGQQAVHSPQRGPGTVGGNEPPPRMRPAYRVTVRMDDGMFRTVSMSAPPPFAVGDRVRLVEGKLARG